MEKLNNKEKIVWKKGEPKLGKNCKKLESILPIELRILKIIYNEYDMKQCAIFKNKQMR